MAVQRKKNVAGYVDGQGRFRPIRSPKWVSHPKRKATPRLKAKYSKAKAGDLGKKRQERALEDVFDREIRLAREAEEAEKKFRARLEKEIASDIYGDPDSKGRGQTLMQFVRQHGGIRRTYRHGGKAYRGRKSSYDAGEINRLSYKETRRRGLTTDKGGMTLDHMFQAAREAGFDVESMDDLISKVEAEASRGQPTYITHGSLDYRDNPSELRVMQITPKSYGVFLRKYLLKKFRTKAAAETYVRSIQARRKTNPAGNELGVEFGDTFRLKHGKGNIDVMVWNVQKNRVKLQRLDTGELVFWPWKNFNMIAKKYGKKVNPSASQMAKAAIAVFDSDFDLDLDGRDVARLRRGEKRMRKAKQTKPNPAKGYADAIDNYRTRPSGTPIVLFDSTPDVLVRLGVANKPLVLSPRKIAEILKKHRLVTLDVIKTAVSKLAEPVMVFRSATRPKSLVLVTDQFPGRNGKPVIAAIEISPNAGRHLVTSVYVKTSVGVIGSWIKSGLLRFINKRKSVRWFQLAGLQLPMSEIIERYAGQKPAANYRLLTEDGPVKQNPINPIMAFAAGASGILSALQIKEHLARNTVEKAKGKTMAKAKAKANPRAGAGTSAAARAKANPARYFVTYSHGGMSGSLPCSTLKDVQVAKDYLTKTLKVPLSAIKVRKPNPGSKAGKTAAARAKANPRPSAKAPARPARKNPKPPARRRTYEMFQGRPSTTAKEMPVSRFAPARLDQLGDLIELKLADGQIIKPNPQRFKLCAAGGKLWIVGGKFAKANPAGKANELNPISRIVHVVYGTRKPHHGDHAYTHYIHKMGEDTGHQPMLAVDREGFPIIRGGQYKIEARGIVN